jgi:hypothetical protein
MLHIIGHACELFSQYSIYRFFPKLLNFEKSCAKINVRKRTMLYQGAIDWMNIFLMHYLSINMKMMKCEIFVLMEMICNKKIIATHWFLSKILEIQYLRSIFFYKGKDFRAWQLLVPLIAVKFLGRMTFLEMKDPSFDEKFAYVSNYTWSTSRLFIIRIKYQINKLR